MGIKDFQSIEEVQKDVKEKGFLLAKYDFGRFLDGEIQFDRFFWRLVSFHCWCKVFRLVV